MAFCVLIPAYRPDDKLIALIESLELSAGAISRAVVVDDGSGEEYAQIFDKCRAIMGVTVLAHEVNRGKGAALRTGIAHIMEECPDSCIVTADADGQHSAEDIMKLGALAQEHTKSLVLGVRDISKMPPRSRAGNTVTRFFFRLATGLCVTDTQTGLRAFTLDILPWLLTVDGDRYEYEMNMLLELNSAGIAFVECGIATIYIENNASTHFSAVRDGLLVFSRVLKYMASSVISTLADFALYALLTLWLRPATGYILSRIVSSVLNYELNSRAVFHSAPNAKNAAAYFLLAAAVMLVGSAGVSFLVSLGVNKMIAKLGLDAVLFVINYFVQKKVIFRRKPVNKSECGR